MILMKKRGKKDDFEVKKREKKDNFVTKKKRGFWQIKDNFETKRWKKRPINKSFLKKTKKDKKEENMTKIDSDQIHRMEENKVTTTWRRLCLLHFVDCIASGGGG